MMTSVDVARVAPDCDPLPLGAHRLLVCKAIYLRRCDEGAVPAARAPELRQRLEKEVAQHLRHCRREYGKRFDAEAVWYLSRSAADGLLAEYDGDVAAAIRAMPYDAGRTDHNSDPVLAG